MAKIQNLDQFIFSEAMSCIDIAFDVRKWAESLGLDIYSNQIEIVEEMCKPTAKNICILGSRSGGKSFGICLGAIRQCDNVPGYEIIIFAPKAKQATRLIEEIQRICHASPILSDSLVKPLSTSKIKFKNGSTITALTADESADIEGWHGNMVIIDESQRVSDLVYRQRIVQMIAASTNPKVVKLGISMYNNHFRQSFNTQGWTKLIHPWYKCPILYKEGNTIDISGVKYPNLIVKSMPLSYKQKYFPDNPELHTPSEYGILEEDFDTQYEMKWVDSLNLFLNEADQLCLFGDHDILNDGSDTDTYYFGLDLAGGSKIKQGKDRDNTALTIVRKTSANVKQVVAMYLWQGDITDQTSEIVALVHPEFGRFKCKFGISDYGNLGSAVTDWLTKAGLKIEGVQFTSTESKTKHNYKNAMAKQFLFDLRNGRFKYPSSLYLNSNSVFKQHINEWCALERRTGTGSNDKIEAPTTGEVIHDDTCCSAFMANWAAERSDEAQAEAPKEGFSIFPKLVIGTTTYRGSTGGGGIFP